MDPTFKASELFAQAEVLPLPRLLSNLKFALVELDRISKGKVRDTVQAAKVLIVPAQAKMAQAASEAQLDPYTTSTLRAGFESLLRVGTRTTGPVRVSVERITIYLRVLELRVVSVVRNYNPDQVAAVRTRMLADLWSEPSPTRAPSDPEFDWRGLPADLHRAWLARLDREWNTLNWYYLEGMLKPPIFELIDSRDKFGKWIPERRTIALSGWHIATHAWHEVVETLKHEMAHQVVAEAWQRGAAVPHGSEFHAACKKLRCSPRGSADPKRLARAEDSTDPTDRIVSRIQKLLRLGGSPNQHEAALAMERASALLAKFNLDINAVEREQSFFRRWIGPILTRRDEYHHNLAVIMSEHFFVRVIWDHSFLPLTATKGVQMVAIGTQENLDVCEYVYDYLTQTTQRLWEEHKASVAHRGGRRTEFLAGLTRGFQDKLDTQRAQLVKETALVFKGDSRLEEHVDHLYPRLSSCRSRGVSRGEDYHIGVEQGREITIHMGVTGGSEGRAMLPPGSESD